MEHENRNTGMKWSVMFTFNILPFVIQYRKTTMLKMGSTKFHSEVIKRMQFQ